MPLWPHQAYALEELQAAIDLGEQRIALTSPTGGGKGNIILNMCEWAGYRDWSTVLLHNRLMLTEQTFNRLDDFGMDYGIQASGYETGHAQNVQVASIQSIHRWWVNKQADLPPAKLVIIDEIHTEKGQRMQEILNEYEKRGAHSIMVTATPIGIGHLATKLITAGNNSQLRACGALIPAATFAPDEPDIAAFKGDTEGILQFREDIREKMMHVICGRVLEYYKRINPTGKPTILFAPDVAGSQYFADELLKAGIPSGHIDADRIIINGKLMPATRENRELLKEASRTGEIKVVCNRFVLREGVDMPWLGHGILACTFGSLQTYLQATGRLLRAFPGMDSITLADHGGNYWRFGSANDDRIWTLENTERTLFLERSEAFRTKGEIEPTPCPQCSKIRLGPGVCQHCGYLFRGKQRMVIQTNGKLKIREGDIYKARKYSDKPGMVKKWEQCVMRCRNSGRTLAQARGLFMYENWGFSPAPHYPYMPNVEADWCLKVKDLLDRS